MALFDNLLAYRKLDEASGTTASDSVGSNTGTASHSWILWSAWKINNWGTFNGTTNYIDCWSSSLQLNEQSVFWWIKTSVSNTWWMYVKKWRNIWWHNHWIAWWLYETWKLCVRLQLWLLSFLELRVVANFYDNNWHHIWYTYTWTDAKLYMDWVELGSTTWTSTYFNWTWLKSSIWCEITTWVPENRFNWLIDEVWIWNRPLSALEITELYNSWSWLQYPYERNNTTNFFNFI